MNSLSYPQQAFLIVKERGPTRLREVLDGIKRHSPTLTDATIRGCLYAHSRRGDSLIKISDAVVSLNDRFKRL